MRAKSKTILVLVMLALIGVPTLLTAKVYYSKSEAMELAFGINAEVVMQSLFPDDIQVARIESLARNRMDSRLFTFYVGKINDHVIGYAAIESHTVRTKPETLMIVLSPTGQLQAVHTLAFHEPPEYQPPRRWYEQLYRLFLPQLDINRDVQGISGATLSTRAALSSLRKVMAVYQVMLGKGQS